MRKAAIVVALAMTAAACAEDGQVTRPPEVGPGGSPSPTPSGADVTLRLSATTEGPVARLSGDRGVVEATPFTSCWPTPQGGECVDGFPTAPEAFVEVPEGATIEVTGDAETVELGVARFRPGDVAAASQVVDGLPLEQGTGRIDVDPGRYLLHVFAEFEQGDGAFALGLRVLPR